MNFHSLKIKNASFQEKRSVYQIDTLRSGQTNLQR